MLKECWLCTFCSRASREWGHPGFLDRVVRRGTQPASGQPLEEEPAGRLEEGRGEGGRRREEKRKGVERKEGSGEGSGEGRKYQDIQDSVTNRENRKGWKRGDGRRGDGRGRGGKGLGGGGEGEDER